jgi:alpha-L-fucosidase
MKISKFCVFLMVLIMSAVLGAQARYTASWASVDKHNPSPEWFKDAKFGIYFHWGVFCVPAFGDEWYPRWMYCGWHGDRNHHIATFGDPNSWPYHNFINGANDKSGKFVQFAPKLKSEGGKFDPVEWATLFDSAGAKFAGPVAEHHDGFSMWDSKVNEWNCVQKGPKIDLASLFESAIRAKGMKFMMSMHHAYNFTGFYEFVPAQNDQSLKKLYGQLGSAAENQLWYDKLKEIIDLYQPDLIWQDWKLNDVSETQRLNFLAYYYNNAIDSNKEVVATYKVNSGNDGFNTKGEVGDFERGGPADITYPYWLTDDAISSSSWCYTEGIGYYSTVQMLHSLIDRVSKNGNMLLNISPIADGTIPQQQRTVLLGMGQWLRRFGESIYATRAWTVYGEGPTRAGGGAFTAPLTGTNKDWRFTCTKDSTTLYATCLGWPGNGANVTISSVTTARFKAIGVYLFDSTAGSYIKLNNFNQSASGVSFTMPATQPYTALAYAFKIISDRSTAIKQAKVVQDMTVATVPGTLFYGTHSWRSINAYKGTLGVEIYSLQGKKIMRYMFDNQGNGDGLKDLQRIISSQACYVKYLTKAKSDR